MSELTSLNEFVDQFISDNCISESVGFCIRLSIEEIAVNIISYAYGVDLVGEIEVDILYDSKSISVVISDRGIAFNPLMAYDPDINLPLYARPIGGLGIFLTKKFMDNISYRRENGKNILILSKELA